MAALAWPMSFITALLSARLAGTVSHNDSAHFVTGVLTFLAVLTLIYIFSITYVSQDINVSKAIVPVLASPVFFIVEFFGGFILIVVAAVWFTNITGNDYVGVAAYIVLCVGIGYAIFALNQLSLRRIAAKKAKQQRPDTNPPIL